MNFAREKSRRHCAVPNSPSTVFSSYRLPRYHEAAPGSTSSLSDSRDTGSSSRSDRWLQRVPLLLVPARIVNQQSEHDVVVHHSCVARQHSRVHNVFVSRARERALEREDELECVVLQYWQQILTGASIECWLRFLRKNKEYDKRKTKDKRQRMQGLWKVPTASTKRGGVLGEGGACSAPFGGCSLDRYSGNF